MKNITRKLLTVIISILITLVLGTSVIYAGQIDGVGPNISQAGKAGETVKSVGNSILGIIQVVGTAIAIGMLLILGIKYMMAAPDEKASIKKSSTMYIVGAVILFSAVAIVTIIKNFATEAIKVGN